MPSTTLDVVDRNCLRITLNIGATFKEPIAYRLSDRSTVQVEIGDPSAVCQIRGPADVVGETFRLAYEAVTDRPLSPITDQSRIDEAQAWLDGLADGDWNLVDIGRAQHHVEALLSVIAAAER